ncbi:MAG TPA: hypothetical protein VK447_01225 [Myxococcaceae bacterium]|nr:hypothetical protein [Myxococcaceae bacterium]
MAKGHDASSEEHATVELAANALHFLHHMQLTEAFQKYLEHLENPVPPLRRVEKSFAMMDEAQRWLEQNPETPLGTFVRIAGVTHAVPQALPSGLRFVRSMSPDDLEST